MKEFIRREEEWNAVGGGSGAPCGDEVSSDEDKDVEEEDKKGRCQPRGREGGRRDLPPSHLWRLVFTHRFGISVLAWMLARMQSGQAAAEEGAYSRVSPTMRAYNGVTGSCGIG